MTQVTSTSLPKTFDWQALFKIVRFPNLLIIAITQYMLKIFVIDEKSDFLTTLFDVNLFALVTATLLVAAAGYIINDYYDVKIDIINKPKRVVIGRQMKRRTAIILNFTFNFVAMLLSIYLGWEIVVINFFAIFLLWLYSNRLKRLPVIGNISISLLTALSVLVVGIYYPINLSNVILFALFSFFISFIREIVKDMEDMKGDSNFGCKTLPIIWGIRRTKRIIYILFVSFALILLFTAISYPSIFVLYLYLAILPLLIWFFIRLLKADTVQEYGYLSNFCKIIMLVGILSMLLV